MLIDAIVVKIRDGQVANRPIYVAMGINLDGERDVLGLWVGPTGGEGAKFWMSAHRAPQPRRPDTFIVCCDGSRAPDAIRATWPLAEVQLCVVHLVRSSLRYTAKKHWGRICRELRGDLHGADRAPPRPASTSSPSVAGPLPGDDRHLGDRPGASSCRSSSSPSSCASVVYTTNAIESLNARFRRAVRHRGHFPNEQAALKVLYLVATERRKNRANPTGRINGWKPILNALTIHYGDRIRPPLTTATAAYTKNRTVPRLAAPGPSWPNRWWNRPRQRGSWSVSLWARGGAREPRLPECAVTHGQGVTTALMTYPQVGSCFRWQREWG